MDTDPSFTDGLSGIANPIVECLNITGDGSTYQRYEYLSDNIDRDAIEKEHGDADGSPLGSHTQEGFTKGSINLQLTKASHKVARPGHIIHLDIGLGDEYYIAGKFGRARTRREVVKGALAVRLAYNPIITSLLSEAYGQRKLVTAAAGVLATPVTDAPTVVNVRSGATKTWSLAAAPGYSVPAWLTIDAGTGALSGTAVAGHWVLYVKCKDTVANAADREGYGILDLTVT